jgi:CPA2 family monovalent cation:H+ antiporter-2
MLAVSLPLTTACLAIGMSWRAALLAGSAGALSSTILVFKSLAELGQTSSPHGRRAVGILLFQDVALVPLLLLVPLLTGRGAPPTVATYALLAAKSVVFVVSILLLRETVARWFVPLLAELRSVELVVLFALCVLSGACFGAFLLGLTPPLGALAAGMVLGGNRLSKQVDTIVLPFREAFAAVFFVTLGTLLRPLAFFEEPLLLSIGLLGTILLKTLAASLALRVTGLPWRSSFGMGLGLAQLGEFSFLLIAEGVEKGIVPTADYSRLLFIALGTLILTPQLLKLGLRWTEEESPGARGEADAAVRGEGPIDTATVIGVGPIGRALASRLETMGVDVCLVDLSPINLHPFGQQGFHTVSGDARDPDVLRLAEVENRRLAVVCVPDDDVATQVVRSLREVNREMSIVVRCRFQANMAAARKAGADAVVSEEAETSGVLLRLCEQLVNRAKTQ